MVDDADLSGRLWKYRRDWEDDKPSFPEGVPNRQAAISSTSYSAAPDLVVRIGGGGALARVSHRSGSHLQKSADMQSRPTSGSNSQAPLQHYTDLQRIVSDERWSQCRLHNKYGMAEDFATSGQHAYPRRLVGGACTVRRRPRGVLPPWEAQHHECVRV